MEIQLFIVLLVVLYIHPSVTQITERLNETNYPTTDKTTFDMNKTTAENTENGTLLLKSGDNDTTSEPQNGQSISEVVTTKQEIVTGAAATEQVNMKKVTTMFATEQVTMEQFTTAKVTTEQGKSEKATTEHVTTEQVVPEQFTTEQTTREQATTEQVGIEKVVTEQATTEQATTEHVTTEQVVTEHITTEQATTEHVSTEQVVTEHITTEQATTEQATTEHVSTKQVSMEQVSTEHFTTAKVSTEQATTENVSTAKMTTGHVTTEEVTAQSLTTISIQDTTERPPLHKTPMDKMEYFGCWLRSLLIGQHDEKPINDTKECSQLCWTSYNKSFASFFHDPAGSAKCLCSTGRNLTAASGCFHGQHCVSGGAQFTCANDYVPVYKPCRWDQSGENCTVRCDCGGHACSLHGECLDFCGPGFTGDDCGTACPAFGQHGWLICSAEQNGTCDENMGFCTDCDKDGHCKADCYEVGNLTHQACPQCKHCANNECTEKVSCWNGSCPREWGPNPCKECPNGRWHTACDYPCPAGCLRCEKLDGVCEEDCPAGTYGSGCPGNCSNNCDPPSICARDTGWCDQCQHGYYGWNCSKPCPAACGGEQCKMETGQCPDDSTDFHDDYSDYGFLPGDTDEVEKISMFKDMGFIWAFILSVISVVIIISSWITICGVRYIRHRKKKNALKEQAKALQMPPFRKRAGSLQSPTHSKYDKKRRRSSVV